MPLAGVGQFGPGCFDADEAVQQESATMAEIMRDWLINHWDQPREKVKINQNWDSKGLGRLSLRKHGYYYYYYYYYYWCYC